MRVAFKYRSAGKATQRVAAMAAFFEIDLTDCMIGFSVWPVN